MCIRNEDHMLTRARADQWLIAKNHWIPFWPWLIAPFVVGAATISVGWIRRGFSNSGD